MEAEEAEREGQGEEVLVGLEARRELGTVKCLERHDLIDSRYQDDEDENGAAFEMSQSPVSVLLE